MTTIERVYPDAHSILPVPENHTGNIFYLQNIAALKTIMQHAGLDVRVGSYFPEIKTVTTCNLPDGQSILQEPVIRKNNQPCVLHAGWPTHDKSKHFKTYNKIADECARHAFCVVAIRTGLPVARHFAPANPDPIAFICLWRCRKTGFAG